jgi:3-methyladenine DNA glycosylase AlkD
MPNLATVMADLKSKASEKTRTIYIRHGAPADRTLGVSAADMKLIAKTIKKQQALACELYETGIFEAMYLAGIVANGAQLTKKQLQSWAEAAANMPMVSEYTVPWVALESADARTLAIDWIKSKKEHVAAAGWCTYSGIVATTPDDELDLPEIEALTKSIPTKIGAAPNRVRLTMNGFVIAVGTYVAPLLKQATLVAKQIGVVSVDVGDTACEVPLATDRIAKAQASGRAGTKRKTIRC